MQDPILNKVRRLERENLDLAARAAKLDQELDRVVALVHDRAPELLADLMEVCS